jgi:hypothetical protein
MSVNSVWYRIQVAFYVMRLFSIVLGAITLIAVYRLARRVFTSGEKGKKEDAPPDNPAVLLAVAFVAFNPMFIFIHASITNDTLATLLATVALVILLAPRPNYWMLGIVLALGAITKLSALTLYPVVGGVLLILILKREMTLKNSILNGLKIIAPFLIIAAWWYVRNVQLYGELTGTAAMIATIGARKTPYTVLDFLNEMQGLRISGWALFGWLNVIGPDWFLTLMDVLTALALLGGIAAIVPMIRAREWETLRPYGILGAYFVIIFVSLINWTRQTPGTQGRLLFPALGAVAVLVALGWQTVIEWITQPERLQRVRRFAYALPIAPMFVVAALVPSLTISPAYAPPRVVAEVPPEAAKNKAFYSMRFEVVGAEADTELVKSKQPLPVTLYYYHAFPLSDDLSLFITVYDCKDNVIGKVDSLPGEGSLLEQAGFAEPASIFQDRYLIMLDYDSGLCQPLIETGWYDTETKENLYEMVNSKKSITFRGGLIWNEQTHPEPPPQTIQTALYSGVIKLNGYTLPKNVVLPGDALPIRLNFQSNARIGEPFTVFYHLLDANGKPIATGDAPPKNDDYPTTAWLPNLAFNDDKTLTVPPGTPPGTYRIGVGFYRPGDLSRLPVETGGDMVILNTSIEVK